MLPKLKKYKVYGEKLTQNQFMDYPMRKGDVSLQQQLQKLSKIVMSMAETVQNNLLSQAILKNQKNSEFVAPIQQIKEVAEDRFKQVTFPISIIHSEFKRQDEIKKFLADVCSYIFSLGFSYFEQGRLNEKNYRLFCCHNLLGNIIRFCQLNKLTEEQIQQIDEHLKNWVIRFLKSKYPQSESAQSNLKLSYLIIGIDNIDANSNDMILKSQVKFEKKQSGDYSSEIMQFLNYIINVTKQPIDGQKSLYSTFYQEMEDFFTKVYDEQWVLYAKQGKLSMFEQNNYSKSIEDGAIKQKYKQKVQEYTKYLIGKKISDNMAPYSETEIKQEIFRTKSPSIMRILTKWCQQLERIFDASASVMEREQMFVMRDGTERYLSKQQKYQLAFCLDEQKLNIDQFLSKVKKNIYENQHNIVSSKTPQTIFRDFCSEAESSVGYMTSIMAKSNQNYLINYLNKLIDCILQAEEMWMKRMNHKSHYKQEIPSLITFKIGDLMRCKCSSKQTQITALFSYLTQYCQLYPKKLQMIRIKNRLSQGTKDILINFRYRNKLTTEMQLSIDQNKSNFIKCSDKANHFLYEIQRASFGPLSQISNICYAVDERSGFYLKAFDKKNQWKKTKPQKEETQKCDHKWDNFVLPIRCSQCKIFDANVDLIVPHKRCAQCAYSKCSNCIINNGEVEDIPISQQINWKDFYQNFKRQQNEIAKLQVIDLEKKQIQSKIFLMLKQQGKVVIFEQDFQDDCLLIERQIKQSKEQQALKKISTKIKIIKAIQLSKQQKQILLKRTKKELFRINLNNILKSHGKIFVYESAKLQDWQVFNSMKIQSVNKISLISTKLNSLKCLPEVFPNCEIAVLSFNSIENFGTIEKWTQLKILHLENNDLGTFPNQIVSLKNLQTLNLRQNKLKQLDNKICGIKSLKILNLQQNYIKIISPQIKNLLNLETLWLKQNDIEQLPQEIGGLSALKVLVLDKNKISYLPTTMKKIISLCILNLNDNLLTELPQDLFSQMSQLQDLWIYGNKLTKIPQSIKNLKNLTRLSAFKNKFMQIPSEISCLINIQYLNLSNNQFNDITQFNQLTLNSLVEFRMNQSSLKSIPYFIYQIRTLKSLHIYGNPISEIEPRIGNLRKLEQFSIAKCSLRQLPQEIGYLKNLRILGLECNKLTKLPQSFKNLTHLQKLDIEENEINNLPTYLFDLPNLYQLHAGKNTFTVIPAEIAKLKKLRSLTIFSDHLTTISEQIDKLQNLTYAEVNQNVLDDKSKSLYIKMRQKIFMRHKAIQNQIKYRE